MRREPFPSRHHREADACIFPRNNHSEENSGGAAPLGFSPRRRLQVGLEIGSWICEFAPGVGVRSYFLPSASKALSSELSA
jgi:hypothetical protein